MLQIWALTSPLATEAKQQMLRKHFGMGSWQGTLKLQGWAGLLAWLHFTCLLKWQHACLKITQSYKSGLCAVGEYGNLNTSCLACKKASISQEFSVEFLYTYTSTYGCMYIYIFLYIIHIYVCMLTEIYTCMPLVSSTYKLFPTVIFYSKLLSLTL